MDSFLMGLFYSQIRDQCDYVRRATEELEPALAAQDTDRVWYCLQNLLSAAANISKALWGVNPEIEKAREPLRASLGITDDSPLRSRELRNHFDHFDERLDEWDKKSTTRIYMDRNILPSGMNLIGGIGTGKHDELRRYFPDTAIATFFGDAYELVPIVQAAVDLLPIAAKKAREPHPDPPDNTSGTGQ